MRLTWGCDDKLTSVESRAFNAARTFPALADMPVGEAIDSFSMAWRMMIALDPVTIVTELRKGKGGMRWTGV